jgi:hypothetical protein
MLLMTRDHQCQFSSQLSAYIAVSMLRSIGAHTLINEKKALLCCGASFSASHLVDMARLAYL